MTDTINTAAAAPNSHPTADQDIASQYVANLGPNPADADKRPDVKSLETDYAHCYHCGLPNLSGAQYTLRIFEQQRRMCCQGCLAVAAAIVENGLQDYYRHRTEMAQTAEDLVPEELRQLSLYDHPDVQKSFVFHDTQQQGILLDDINVSLSDVKSNNAIKQDIREASLILEGITCAACIWLNERHLEQLPGVMNVAFNYSSQRARIRWNDSQIKLSSILAEIRKLGYHAHPYSAQQQHSVRAQQRKLDYKRLAVAGLSSGQVMMLAVALYAGAAQGMEAGTAELLRWFSLVLSVPAITYAAAPFYRAAWRGLVNRRIGMDVPIVLGVLTGFAGSLWATIQGHGAVYYDTITMLIFFLLATRMLERNAREKSIEAAENLLRLAPAMATRVQAGQQQLLPVMQLNLGDIVLAKPGETIAVDGHIVNGESSVDESLLTGESRALPKKIGDAVFAGSINYESPLMIRVSAVSENTMLAGIARLLDRAQAEKPQLAMVADNIAGYFTYALLFAVIVIGLVWWQLAPERTLEIVLTVLVVSCPCALSLAAPAAFAAAGSHLVQRGVLLTRGHALEALAKVNHVVFDKTGTLTQGKPVLLATTVYAHVPAEECLKLAASLEKTSEHPLAKSFIAAINHQPLYNVDRNSNVPGQGVIGDIAGKHYTLGNAKLDAPAHAAFLAQGHAGSADARPGANRLEDAKLRDPEQVNTSQANASASAVQLKQHPPGASLVWLSEGGRLLAAFVLADQPRPQAAALIQALEGMGIKQSIFSGDASDAVAHFAQSMGIAHSLAALSPEQKLAELRALQQQGRVVAMVGDGINDAPVLAGAQVSIAMGSGTQMARTSGDVVLLSENLLEISHSITTSRFGISVIRQNFAWALGYNLIALPFAATGTIAPWMAAIGMSVSSLIVVLNALRLR